MPRTTFAAALLLAFAAAPPGAFAQTAAGKAKAAATDAQIRSYRCVGADGKKYYGSTRPPQCAGVVVEGLSAQGTVLRRFDPPLTPEQRAAQEAAAQKTAVEDQAKRDAASAAKMQARRDQALLQTYSSEKDIEMVRARALADNQKAREDVERRIAQLKKRQDDLAKRAAKDGKPVGTHEQDVRAVAYDLELQQRLLVSRDREAAAINARYDAEKRKYLELTKGAGKK
jgi:hypothetical protein